MTKKIESHVDWKIIFLKLTKKLEKRLSLPTLKEQIEEDKHFRSMALPLLFKEYDDLSQLFKNVKEEEMQELKRVKYRKNLEIFFFENFLKKVEAMDSKVHEEVINTVVRYGEGNMTLSEFRGNIVSILSDHEDLVGEFLENVEEPIDDKEYLRLRRHKICLEKAYTHMKKKCVYRPKPCGTMRRKPY
ncbi:unnamed protein product [Arabis nemorensis]|uniref:Uncharacterized protein n=1 Tax=Arabis nemorensis TaxID=586526 RepID=A0A565CJX8_9BRAS|nr:unnamed protein product [Arabis nemorensis]